MGKVTGFLEIERQDRGYEKPDRAHRDLSRIRQTAAALPNSANRRRAAWIAAFPFVTRDVRSTI